MEKIKEFRKILNRTSLSEVNKRNILFILEYFEKKHPEKLASRSYLFAGMAGIGKTYLAEKLLNVLDKEVVTVGCADFQFRKSKKCGSLSGAIPELENDEEQILFLDDLNYLLEKDDCGEVDSEHKRAMMMILEIVKRNPNKILLATINNMYELDRSMIDRIEVKVSFDLPNETNKRDFLISMFKGILTPGKIDFIAKNSIGYNYRDLPELIKLAYRIGRLTKDSIKEAIKTYRCTELYGFDIRNGIDTKLSDVIGKEPAVKTVKRIALLYKNSNLVRNLGLSRPNLLLFHGEAGTGKSFMARALAGEIGFPIIKIQARRMYRDPLFMIGEITDLAKRYRNCIVFIDEADKMFGNSRFGDDSPLIAEFNDGIEGIDDAEVQAIFILAMNDITRFGNSFTDRFIQIQFDKPNYEERKTFCKRKIEHTKKHLPLSIDYDFLARRTKDMSYRDIERIWNELVYCHLETSKKITHETITDALKHTNMNPEKDAMFG